MVTYVYADSSAHALQRNRLVAIRDMSGIENYGYHPTGELKSITGERGTEADTYLKAAGYTPYGETAYRQMGNGTEHIYTYDENERLESSTLDMNGSNISANTNHSIKVDPSRIIELKP